MYKRQNNSFFIIFLNSVLCRRSVAFYLKHWICDMKLIAFKFVIYLLLENINKNKKERKIKS